MTEDEARDQLATLQAMLDQSMAAMPEHARLVAVYYSALVAEGMEPDYALALTLGFQSSYFAPVWASTPEE